MTGRARRLLAVVILPQLLLSTATARLPDMQVTLPIVTGVAALDHAERVALMVLTADQSGDAHRAAPFYKTPWIRDSYAWGMIPDDVGTLGTYATGELSYWLSRQQPFGGWISFEYSGWYDETAILIAAVLNAYRLTGDKHMVQQALPALRRGWQWLDHSYVDRRRGSSCLLWASLRPKSSAWAADWADQVARQGYTPQLEGLWYRATQAMAAMEWLAGSRAAASYHARATSCIYGDTNRLLWTVDAPAHRNAAPLPAFGHYRARSPGGDYFEIDGNAVLVASGIAGPRKRSSVLSTIDAHAAYILGQGGAGPARVVYGDYAPQDYAPIHNWMGAGRYQCAYWPSVGGLLAMAAARNDDTGTSMAILRGLAWSASDADSAFYEWYGEDGTPGGAGQYEWGARMYLLALYQAYLGVDDSSSMTTPADLVLRAAPGPARGELVRLGIHISVVSHGAGRFRYARLGGRTLRSNLIPARLLYNGAVLDVYRG